MSDTVTSTASVFMGRNVRKLRGDHTSDELARECAAWGIKGGTGRVSEIENGKVSPTIPTVYLLTLALGDLLGRPVAPSELFAGSGPVSTPGGEIELRLLRAVLADEAPKRPRPHAPGIDEFIDKFHKTWPEPLKNAPSGPYRKTLAAMVEADLRVGKSLGLDRALTAAWMAYLWRKPLSAERDRRAGARANAQKRGQISRQLKSELTAAIKRKG
jgi:hypothetical protein